MATSTLTNTSTQAYTSAPQVAPTITPTFKLPPQSLKFDAGGNPLPQTENPSPVQGPSPVTQQTNPYISSAFPKTITSDNLKSNQPLNLPTLGPGQKYYGVNPGADTIALDARLSDIRGGNQSIQSAIIANPVPTPEGHPGIDANTGLPNPTPAPVQPAGPTPTAYDSALNKILGLNNVLGTQGQVANDLYSSLGIDQATRNKIQTYNDYQKSQFDLNNQLADLKLQSGGTTAGTAASMAELQRIGSVGVANKAYLAQVASGNLEAATNIMQAKLNMQFQPVKDQIDYIGKYIDQNRNDLSKSETVQLENKRFQLQNNLETLKSAKVAAHQFALQQGIQDPAILNAIDNATTPTDVYTAVGGTAQGIPTIGSNTPGVTNISQQYQPYITQSNDGTKYVNQDQLKNLTPYQTQEAARQYAQSGIKVLQPDEASKIQNIDVTRQNLDQLSTVTKDILGSGLYGRTIGAAWNKISQGLQLNPEIASFNSYRDTAINTIQALAGGSGSGFRLNQAEINTAASNIPTITDNLETANKKIANLNSFLNKWTKELLPKSNVNTGTGAGNVSDNPFSQSNFYGK